MRAQEDANRNAATAKFAALETKFLRVNFRLSPTVLHVPVAQ
jgi:hypothetical protein